MKKNLLHITTLAIMVLLAACSNDEIFEKNDSNPAPNTGRTLSLTAAMPGDNSDNPTTRVGLEQLGDKSIDLTWEDGDELQLAFVQGETKIKGKARVKNITREGKKAQFDIVIPDGITDGSFDLYGIYGGGGLDDADPTKVILPTKPGSATSLASVKERKDVMLHFESKCIQTASPQASVVFKHLGSLFNITIKNSSATSLYNLAEARLVGPEGGNWAYNAETSGQSYDLVSGKFQNQETAGNYIFFKAVQSTLAIGESITFWGWYPPLPEAVWPELQLELRDETNTLITSINNTTARTEATAAGKSYYLFGVLDGAQLNFTDESYAPPMGDNEYWVMPMGTLGGMLTQEQKSTITTMIIRGEINKADFEVMKSQMPNLTHIDLKDVKCESNAIPNSAFKNNTTISTIILPLSITSIGNSAFESCYSLGGTLAIPKGVTSIGNSAFWTCFSLTGSLTIPEGVTSIDQSAFYNCYGFKGTLTIPETITSIGNQAFNGCSGLTGSLTIPEGITSIGSSVFSRCSGFTGSLTIPDGVTTIGDWAFENCSGLTGDLTIPKGVTSIGYKAFDGCSSFTGKVVFPANLSTIGEYGFWNCTNIDAFRFPHTSPITYTAKMLNAGTKVEVPAAARATYKADYGWKDHPIAGYLPLEGDIPGMQNKRIDN